MYLVDSHCHLDQLDDLPRILAHAAEQQIQHMLCVCITLRDFPAMLDLVKQHAHLSASVGLHPNERDIDREPTAEEADSIVTRR